MGGGGGLLGSLIYNLSSSEPLRARRTHLTLCQSVFLFFPSLLPSFLSPAPPPSSSLSPPSVQMYQCPYCKFTNTDLNRLRMHVMTQHSVQPMLRCPLCQDMLNNKIHLQFHLTHLHSVAPDCVDKLIATVSPAEVARRFLQLRRLLPRLPFQTSHKVQGRVLSRLATAGTYCLKCSC